MRLTLAVLCVAVCTSMASAQTQSEQKQPAHSQHSTGRTVLPDDNKGQLQPQGRTGPITTGSGGAPAEFHKGSLRPACSRRPTVPQRLSLIRSSIGLVATSVGPTMFARIGVMRALNGHVQAQLSIRRVRINHWGRRTLARER